MDKKKSYRGYKGGPLVTLSHDVKKIFLYLAMWSHGKDESRTSQDTIFIRSFPRGILGLPLYDVKTNIFIFAMWLHGEDEWVD